MHERIQKLQYLSLHETPDFHIEEILASEPRRVVARVSTLTDKTQLDYFASREASLETMLAYHHNSTLARIGTDGKYLERPLVEEAITGDVYRVRATLEITRYADTFLRSMEWWKLFSVGDSVGKGYFPDKEDLAKEMTIAIPERAYLPTEKFTEQTARDVIRKIISWQKLPLSKILVAIREHPHRFEGEQAIITRVDADFGVLEHYVSPEHHPNHTTARWGTAKYERNGVFFLEFKVPGGIRILEQGIDGLPTHAHIELYRPRYRNQRG